MFDDSQTNQKDENQMNGVDSVASSASGLSSGAISDPAGATVDPLGSPLVHPTAPPQDEPPSLSGNDNSTSPAAPSLGGNNNEDALGNIKRQALEQLSPLVHKLDQAPEEKYKTLMMMIQASDNQDLLSEAYAAAQKITDEKAKAEALLNIVNEINYFTQKN